MSPPLIVSRKVTTNRHQVEKKETLVIVALYVLAKLPARGVNVGATGVSDRGFDANRGKSAYEFACPCVRGRLEARPLDLVQLDEIDVREVITAEVAKGGELVLGIVDTLDERILVGGSTSGFVNVFTHNVIKMQ